ncbi:unnamed protein product, partial [Iphiclides podalirius]
MMVVIVVPTAYIRTMGVEKLAVFLALFVVAHCYPRSFRNRCEVKTFQFVSREEWGARRPFATSNLSHPVPYVVIHHSYLPAACYTREACAGAMRSMQNFHQITQGWVDIGYNFAVGGDGAVYEGRGWNAIGAHAVGFNVKSIGIVLIGDWRAKLPPGNELETVKRLISTGVQLGYIRPDYKLLGHRQVTPTECPGEALYREISTWDRFSLDI